jgi:hypothetical protein
VDRLTRQADEAGGTEAASKADASAASQAISGPTPGPIPAAG